MKEKKTAPEKSKPFLTGAPTDENTVKQALKFFGMMLLIIFMSFLVCSMTGFNSRILSIIVNLAVEGLILLVVYTKGADLGTDGVVRGEILYQHIQKGIDAAESEKRIPFNKMKGFIIGLLGSALFLVFAILLAVTTKKQMTGAGVLPSWTEGFIRRSEFRNALAQYIQPSGITFTDIMRILVRMMLMPFVSMVGADNTDILLVLERISPLLVLLAPAAYGAGYLTGPAKRRQVHTEIAKNTRKRIMKEKKEQKARRTIALKEPKQLN